MKRFVHRKAATLMQADLTISPPDSRHLAGKFHGSAMERAPLQLLASIVDRCEDAIISATTDGVVMTWNNAAERIFGYTAGEIVGQPLARLLQGEAVTDLKINLARIMFLPM